MTWTHTTKIGSRWRSKSVGKDMGESLHSPVFDVPPASFLIPYPGARRRGAEEVSLGPVSGVGQKVPGGVARIPEHHIFGVAVTNE